MEGDRLAGAADSDFPGGDRQSEFRNWLVGHARSCNTFRIIGTTHFLAAVVARRFSAFWFFTVYEHPKRKSSS